MRLILTGLPCVGKSFFGSLAAKRFGIPFFDTDQIIEERARLSCRELYRKVGEQGFRSLEREAVASLPREGKAMIALGGGTLSSAAIVNEVQSLGAIVYVKSSPAYVFCQLKKRGIPPYLDPQDPFSFFLKMAEERMVVYEAAASFVVDAEKHSVEHILLELEQIGGMSGKQ